MLVLPLFQSSGNREESFAVIRRLRQRRLSPADRSYRHYQLSSSSDACEHKQQQRARSSKAKDRRECLPLCPCEFPGPGLDACVQGWHTDRL